MPMQAREQVLARLATAHVPAGTAPDYGLYRAQVEDEAGRLPSIPGGFILSHQLGPAGDRHRTAAHDARHVLRGNPIGWFVDAFAPEGYLPVPLPVRQFRDVPTIMTRARSEELLRACPVDISRVSPTVLRMLGVEQAELESPDGAKRVANGVKLLVLSAWRPVDGDGGLLVAGYPSKALRDAFPNAATIVAPAIGSILVFRDFDHALHGRRAVLSVYRNPRGFARKTLHELKGYGAESPELTHVLAATQSLLGDLDVQWRRGAAADIKNALMTRLETVVSHGMRVLERCYSPDKAQARRFFEEARELLRPAGMQNPSAVLTKLSAIRTRVGDRLSSIGDQQVYASDDQRAIQVYVVEFEKWFDDLRADMLADPLRTLRRLKNPELPCLEMRPARPLAYSLFRLAERLRDPSTDAAPRETNTNLRESRLVNQAWTVLRLERMLRQVDEVSRLVTFNPPASPVLFENALREPGEPLHLLEGGFHSTGGHRNLAGDLAALRAFVDTEARDYRNPRATIWSYDRLVQFRDTVNAIIHGKKIPDGGYTSPSYGLDPRTYPELVTDRFEAAARSLALRTWAAYLNG